MINKNFYRKTNDKKILHKVGKQWKVISVALLMAVAGGAVAATHANANADANVNADGNQPYLANQPIPKPVTPKANNNQNVAPTSASIHYYPGHSGAAASYFDKAASDEALANKNAGTVNAYVQSLNDEYNPQVHSYATQYNSANSAAHNDSKLAQSYNAKINTPKTVNTINSLAAKNKYNDPDFYVDAVQANEEAYSGAVKSASANSNAASTVNSLANLLEGTNLSAASFNASESAIFAKSNSINAYAKSVSVADFYGNGVGDAAGLVDAANELDAGARELNQEGNMGTQQAELGILSHGLNNTQATSLTSGYNSAVSSLVSSASVALSNARDNSADIEAYAANGSNNGGFNNNFVSADSVEGVAGVVDNGNSDFAGAVSAGVDLNFSASLASVANSLYGRYNPLSLTASERATASASANRSANAKSLAASYAWRFASANSNEIQSISDEVTTYSQVGRTSSEAAALAASAFLDNGVYGFEQALGLGTIEPSNPGHQVTTDYQLNNPSLFTQKLINQVASSTTDQNKKDTDMVALAQAKFTTGEKLSDIRAYINNNHIGGTNIGHLKTSTDLFDQPTTVTEGAHGVGFNPIDTDDYNFDVAALLSDGVDIAQMKSNSAAYDNIAAAVNNASKDNNVYDGTNDANRFTNDLSAASSSADSVLASVNNASADYSAANDEDVTLASYFANSYSNEANAESASASNAYVTMNDFFKNMTGDDPVFVNADNAYAGAKAAAASDHKMGVENANNVYNNKPHFLDVLKNAKLHSTANFNTKPDEVVATAHKGDRLTVLHVAFSRNNSWRGALRYYVLDNTTGKKGFFTGQPQFSKGAYLPSTIDTADVSVKVLRPVNVYNNISNGKKVASLKPGQIIDNVRVVYANPDRDAMGFTKVETSDYNFFTANTDYVVFNTYTVNNNTQNNNSKFYNLNLGNNRLGNDFNDNSFDY